MISSLRPACSQLMNYGYHNHSVWNVSRQRRSWWLLLFPVSATCSGKFGMFGHWTYGMNRSNVNSNVRLSWTVPTAWNGARGTFIKYAVNKNKHISIRLWKAVSARTKLISLIFHNNVIQSLPYFRSGRRTPVRYGEPHCKNRKLLQLPVARSDATYVGK